MKVSITGRADRARLADTSHCKTLFSVVYNSERPFELNFFSCSLHLISGLVIFFVKSAVSIQPKKVVGEIFCLVYD